MPAYPCPHPYFPSELLWVLAVPMLLLMASFLVVVGGLHWIATRSKIGVAIVASGALIVPAAFAGIVDRLMLRSLFGTEDLARLQHELLIREADLERYGREYPGLSNSQIVEGFLATHQRPNGFFFDDPAVPPLFFKVSDWRDTVPRIVVDFGCSNNAVFDTTTMAIEQLD